MRFDQKIMNYVCGDITRTKIINCRKCIEKQAEAFGGGFTLLQVITLKAMLKTLRSRIEKECTENLDLFNSLFSDIMGVEIKK